MGKEMNSGFLRLAVVVGVICGFASVPSTVQRFSNLRYLSKVHQRALFDIEYFSAYLDKTVSDSQFGVLVKKRYPYRYEDINNARLGEQARSWVLEKPSATGALPSFDEFLANQNTPHGDIFDFIQERSNVERELVEARRKAGESYNPGLWDYACIGLPVVAAASGFSAIAAAAWVYAGFRPQTQTPPAGKP